MRKILSIVILVSGFSVGTLWAQRTSASLSGTVTDPSGASVPEAKMQATELSTGAKYTAVTNQAGFYVLTNLAPGQYSVEVKKDGFKTFFVPISRPAPIFRSKLAAPNRRSM